MVSKELGPSGIFSRLRAHFARTQKKVGGLYDMISCVACVSIYVGAVTALWLAGGVFGWVVYTLAFSAIAMILEQIYVAIKSK